MKISFAGLGMWVALAVSSMAMGQPTVKVVVTVDWEGQGLVEGGLQKMRKLRSDFPEVPMLHFINAAYYTKTDANPTVIARKMRSVLKENDEIGLHIHGWKSLFEASGVHYRAHPNFFTDPFDSDCNYDCGHDVPISSYTQEELEKVMAFSVRTLRNNGFLNIHSFRAGGWMASADVTAALAHQGFRMDYSAVPAYLLAGGLAGQPLLEWVTNLWKGIDEYSQPYWLDSGILEVPDNGALADYVDAAQMIAIIKRHVEKALASGKSELVVIGYHQETAGYYLDRIRKTLEFIRHYNAGNPVVSIVYPALPLPAVRD